VGVTGDYKLAPDGISETFEPVKCHTFITESTFGLPIYHWQPAARSFLEQINTWWRANQAEGKTSVIAAYALGKPNDSYTTSILLSEKYSPTEQ